MYEWRLGGGVTTCPLGPELSDIHQTRLELMEHPVREAIAAAGSDATVIDLACNEGWFSHRMLDWGASRVLGVDIRPETVRRAQLLRDHLVIDPERFEVRCANVFDLSPTELGAFDVVLCLGLVYHLENPIGAMRIARALTGSLCVIESQLTRQSEPIVHGWGESDKYEEAPASFATRIEADHETNPLASVSGIVSLIPNQAALLQSAEAAGFTRLELAKPSPTHNRQYMLGDRAVLLARP
jgi:hypothetical protein